jgi:molecular chaperone GrpE
MTDHKKRVQHKDQHVNETVPPMMSESEEESSQAAQAEAEIISGEDVDALRQELEQARTKSAEYFDGWQRERADFVNFRRRVERDQTQTYQSLQGSIIKKYLPVLDDLGRALKSRPAGGDAASWANGIELIYRKLQAILESEGVKRMPAEEELFDPTRHEAITMEDSPNHQSGEIIEVIQDGYLLGDRVLRPAQVRVAR